MSTLLPTIDEIGEAQKFVYALMQPTPQLCWPQLNEKLEANVWVKHENHTPIGAFKARTAIVYAEEIFREEKGIKGLIAATRGNHGQSVALAGQRYKVPVTIVVPHGNSIEKNAAMRSQGARLVEFGNDFQSAREHAERIAKEELLHFVPSYHRNIVKGVATYWMEFFSVVPDLDVVYVPIGMGSGISAGCAVRNGMKLRTKIVGVVSEGAPAYALSFDAGRKIIAPATTVIADGVACSVPDDEPLQIIRENVDHIIRVSDEEIREAMRIYFSSTHNVIEGAGAAGLAAAMQERTGLIGKRIGLIATGGNVDREVFANVLLEKHPAYESRKAAS